MDELRWRERDLDLRRGADFLGEVHEVCRLHVAQDPATRDADITELTVPAPDGLRLDHLVVSYRRGPWEERFVVGAHEGRVTAEVLDQFRRTVCQPHHGYARAELVQRFAELDGDLCQAAAAARIWLRSWPEYQRVWDHAPYVARQSDDLRADPAYPLDLHIDKRWAPLGEQQPWDGQAMRRIVDWLATDDPRFVLVLGDFGTGKTFLLHALADELARAGGLVPVLVTMRDLEKGRDLDELLAQHMSKCGEDPFHLASFRYLLRQGRVALLFDGFDELALRTSFERVPHHFRTLRQAAEGAAKIVVTSRHQYFATDTAVRTALGADIEALPGSRTIRLFPLDPEQRRAMVVAAFDGAVAEADRFLGILGRVRGLLELATNARMLTFLIRWFRDGVLTERAIEGAGGGEPMTQGRLYELLLTEWLEYELRRQSAAGSYRAMSVDQRLAALGEVAQRLWDTGDRSVHPAELGELAGRVADLAALELHRGEAGHAMASSTVLVRLANDEFAFIHQSVMEWFVAWRAKAALAAGRGDGALAHRELTGVVVDFLCDLAGEEAVFAWARRTAGAPDTPGVAAKANAALILQRRGVTTGAANYAGEDLRGRDLSHQDLTGAMLAGADLSGAVLPRAMRGADLSGARLVRARLDRADLVGANLTGADLTGSRLVGADLRGTSLAGAVLDRAKLVGAVVDAGALAGGSAFGAALPDAVLRSQLQTAAPASVVVTMRDGELLVTAHGPSIVISDASTGRQLRTLTGHHGRVLALVVASDGSWLASADTGGVVRLWDPGSGRQLRTLTGHRDWVLALVVAPDGSWLASAGVGGVVRLWDPGSGRELRSLTGHRGSVLVVAPDGSWLASAGTSGVVRLWDPGSGRQLRTLTGHGGQVRALAVAPDGSWLASAGEDGVVRLWNPQSGAEIAALVADSDGWAVLLPDGRYKLRGSPNGVWWAAGLCRFDPDELAGVAEFQPHLTRLDDDVRILA